MAAFAVKDFGGEIPRLDSRLLPDNMAASAWNCDLAGGDLVGLPAPELVRDFAGLGTQVQRAYRLPPPNGQGPDAWLALPSPYSSVCRGPLANDTLHRIYWTNPLDSGAPGAWWSTYARLIAGQAPYNLGFTAPNPAVVPSVAPSGGTTGVPQEVRAYLYTFVDQYGLESSPSEPSNLATGYPDATWAVTGLPTTAPGSPGGKLYPTVVSLNLYRTVVGGSSGGQYYFVANLPFPTAGSYSDTIPTTTIVNNLQLQSASWLPPPDNMDGLTALPGGMLIGFTNNTLHFCEPDRPHAWPAGYDVSAVYDIVAIAMWQTSLVVLTSGFPCTGTGTSPASFSLQPVQVPEPCIARGSVVVDLLGVYYASPNGLVMLNYFGMQNQSLQTMTRRDWNVGFQAQNIIACRHRAQYLAINGTGLGFILDFTEQRMGVVRLNTFVGAVAIWNDEYTGDTYICSDRKVYLWDSPRTAKLPYRWRSKQFYLPQPTSLGACQISLSPDVTTPAAAAPQILVSPDPALTLPQGVNCLFRLFVGDGHLVMEEAIDTARALFRLPSGFMSFAWQFEVVSRVPIYSVELASTMKELKRV